MNIVEPKMKLLRISASLRSRRQEEIHSMSSLVVGDAEVVRVTAAELDERIAERNQICDEWCLDLDQLLRSVWGTNLCRGRPPTGTE
jgi:hypothetical protein